MGIWFLIHNLAIFAQTPVSMKMQIQVQGTTSYMSSTFYAFLGGSV